ncbi:MULTISPECIES: very short patch repair endonuclease [Parabacteroides]|jgi:DNA mismatch endonuclease (patch repair protein)|uniref:very short patch repair endonuclease n=1 Tax=Parabacteroides TaxID=375288 RepID=UPI000F00F529|nr:MULTISPECIES: very short patch repair endonuclease [Parabacteroides]RHU25230.1 DNA mismatch endonuclease Vsr [Parabacteroides sp. TM07-1AC]WFE85159.1 very short patch repair endonuclease [Parabacteroides chongii]
MDTLSKEQRHKNMAAVHSTNTKPEIIVRKYLFSRGFRYRLNHPRLPGHPDIVLRKYRTCIFINGCFWHGHEGCKYFVIPKSNTEFWTKKINRNIERDKKVRKELIKMGWYCITIWECELKPKIREQTLTSLLFTLNHIFLKDHTVSYPINEDEESSMVAEKDITFYETKNKNTFNSNKK